MTAIQGCPHGLVQFNCSVCYVEMAKELVSLRRKNERLKLKLGTANETLRKISSKIPNELTYKSKWYNVAILIRDYFQGDYPKSISQSEGKGEGGGMEE